MTQQQTKKSSSKRLRRIIFIAMLVIILVIAYAYIFGTRSMLEYAENLAFRRLAVTQLEQSGSDRFFYATNRQPMNERDAVEDRYSSERGEKLHYGFFDTRIEPALGLGMIIDPSDWLINEEIQLLDVGNLGQQDFVDQLRKQVDATPQRTLLLVIHGFRESYPSALRKTAFIGHVLDINTPVVLFDWPGDQGSSLRGYRRARQVARESGGELASFLELLINQVQPDRLWLLANSMGGQVVVDAFRQLYQDADFSDIQTEIENVVLTAADVDHASFNETFRNQIKALTSNITVYVSSNDRALFASRLINRGKRLGESTFDPGNPDVTETAMSYSELLEDNDEQLVLVDVTPVNRTRNFHNFSLETPEFYDDLFLRLTRRELPQTRELYPVRTPEGKRYFVLTRGR